MLKQEGVFEGLPGASSMTEVGEQKGGSWRAKSLLKMKLRKSWNHFS